LLIELGAQGFGMLSLFRQGFVSRVKPAGLNHKAAAIFSCSVINFVLIQFA
jgi:hypothetical protein